MTEKAVVDNKDLAEDIASLIIRHPTIYYSIQLEDSGVLRHRVAYSPVNDTFYDIFSSYNDALFESVRLIIRYEKSLKAWSEIVSTVEDKVLKDTLVMDYVHPVFVTACDLPNVFKDQLVRGCVKLASVVKGDTSYLRDCRLNWFNAMKRVCSSTDLGIQLCSIVDDDLYNGADAMHFREIHGSGMHDLSQTLVSGSRQSILICDGVVALACSRPFNLDAELEMLDRHRRRLQNAYLLFGGYGDALYRNLA